MKRVLSLMLAAAMLAFFTVIAAEKSRAQDRATGQKVQTQEKTEAAIKTKAARSEKWGSFDDDGDGIVNCQDPDYVRPKDGTGKQLGKLHQGKGMHGRGSVSNAGGNAGTGICDGTGPKGKGRSR